MPADTNPSGRDVLVAFATSEGQTAKVAAAFADRLRTRGLGVHIADLADRAAWPDPAEFAAVVLAASVHAGKHQAAARDFVETHRATLEMRVTGFASVSLAAASEVETGRRRARDQVDAFLRETGWRPDEVECIAGAFHFSRFSGLWRWIIRASQRLFGNALRAEGWPSLTQDTELTDWAGVRAMADRLAARLG